MRLPLLLAQIDENRVSIPQPDFTGDTIQNILQVVFGIIGAAALIVVILAALKYSLSLGDPQKTAQAKNALIYAGVGLAVSILAFSIVSFVLDTI
jgi:hypothetical protein